MIIGIDASRANRKHKSGTEWYSYYLIRWLAKLDRKNQYILYTDEPLKGGLLNLSTEQHYSELEKEEKIQVNKKGWQEIKSPGNNFRAKVLKWPLNFFWTQGRMSLEMLFNKIDLLFVPAHALPFVHPKKSVVTIHDVGFEREGRLFAADQMGPEAVPVRRFLNLLVRIFTWGKYKANTQDYLRWSTEFALKKASNIITVSNFTKYDINDIYKADMNKITTIYNGYNKGLYKKTTDQEKINNILIKYGIEEPYLLYVGRIEKKKNIPLLIEAFAIIKENNPGLSFKLVLIGDASYGYDEVNYMISEFNLLDDIIMPGWVEEEDMPIIFSGAQALIFPSNYEGFGIPLLQAMATGVPIIASNVASIPEVVGEAAHLFDPSYALSISRAIEEVILDKDLADKLVKKGEEQVKNFSWEKSARETWELFNSILEKP